MMREEKTILIVDDTELNIEVLMGILEDKYDLLGATSGEDALAILEEESVDLILLDIMMPEMDGYEVCERIKIMQKHKDVPIIFITAKTDEDPIEKAYEVGGVDYVTKPFRTREVLSRISTHLSLNDKHVWLKEKVEAQTKTLEAMNNELENSQREILLAMGYIGELRSRETANHVMRVALYSEVLALGYGLSQEEAVLLKDVSPMHDIGKVGIFDSILKKKGKLTALEYEQMKTHASIGHDLFKNSKSKLLQAAAVVSYEHHEKYDGTGYPRGLKGDNIHIYGRITALADVFDALASDRVYKKAWKDERIFSFIKEESGRHFDPKLVAIFFENLDTILMIREQYQDHVFSDVA